MNSLILALLASTAVAKDSKIRSPEAPSQQCADDAGAPWVDDKPGKAYYADSPALPLSCPPPLAAACETKGIKAALLDGPLDCGGKGWFCRIMPQPGWRNPDFVDYNFAHCNETDADYRDDNGHCHGSDTDDTAAAAATWIVDTPGMAGGCATTGTAATPVR